MFKLTEYVLINSSETSHTWVAEDTSDHCLHNFHGSRVQASEKLINTTVQGGTKNTGT